MAAQCSALFFWFLIFIFGVTANAQELVITPSHASNYVGGAGDPVVIIGDLKANLSNPPLTYVTPLSDGPDNSPLKPHGLSMVSADQALVTHIAGYRGGLGYGTIDIIDTLNARLTGSVTIPDYQSDGLGTVAVNPAKNKALVFSGGSSNRLFVISAPFTSASSLSEVTMPSNGGTAQTHAIVFDNATGRAYVGHDAGISALDPPYASIAFTIPLTPSAGIGAGRAIAMSPDGSILASNVFQAPAVQIVRAPFGVTSAATTVAVPDALALDGLTFTPDGSQLLIVDQKVSPTGLKAYAISAPYQEGAHVETLLAGSADSVSGFEDIDISADGTFAALSGGSETYEDPVVVLRAPFTAAAVRAYPIVIPPQSGIIFSYDQLGGRGTGSARFWSEPIHPLPQITADYQVSVTEGDSGTTQLYVPVRLLRASSSTITVDYATSDYTASAPARYVATTGTLTFKPGETYARIAIPVVGNTIHDGDGDFFLNLSNPTNATILEDSLTIICQIFDNDVTTVLITTPSPLPDAYVGAPYSFTFSASGSATGYANWSAVRDLSSGNPAVAGLSMNPQTGELSGTPARQGVHTFSVQVFDSGATTSTYRAYELTVGDDRIFADDFEIK